jgi:hypothetical protein
MRWRLLVGSLLILAGILALVDAITGLNLGDLVWAVLFIFGGLAFISVLTADRKNWWAAIPGFTLIGIGAEIGIDNLFPVFTEAAGGAFVLGGIGLAFLVVYLLDRSFWWAIIPMGVMFSLVALILLEPYLPGSEVIFFLGLAATFGVLALLPIDNGKRTFWPVIPAGVLLVIGLIVGIGSYNWTGFLMPVVIIAVGVYLLVRAMRAQA